MTFMFESGKVSVEVRVKNEPICEVYPSQKVKEEPIDMSQEVEIKAEEEEKFSTTEQFTNKISIAFLNEETTSNDDKRRYKCNSCNKSFSASSHLVVHKRIHTGKKPYECDICKKGFRHSSYLVVHRRTHTGERPHECEICKKGFIKLGQLLDHKRIHTGEKPYKCDICNKCYTSSSNLYKHKQIHNRL